MLVCPGCTVRIVFTALLIIVVCCYRFVCVPTYFPDGEVRPEQGRWACLGEENAEVLVAGDSITRPLFGKVQKPDGRDGIFYAAKGGATVADILAQVESLHQHQIGLEVTVILAGANDVSRFVTPGGPKSTEDCRLCAERMLGTVARYLEGVAGQRVQKHFVVEMIPQRWQDAAKQRAANETIQFFRVGLRALANRLRDGGRFVAVVGVAKITSDMLEDRMNALHLRRVDPTPTFQGRKGQPVYILAKILSDELREKCGTGQRNHRGGRRKGVRVAKE